MRFLRCCSVAKLLSCVWLCDPVGCSMPGFLVLHCLWEFVQIHVHWVGDVFYHLIFCRPLLLLPSIFPNIRVFSNESALCIRWPKHWSFSLASVLPVNIQDWFPLGWTGWTSLQAKRFSRVFPNTTFKSTSSSVFSFLYGPTLTSIHDHWKNHSLD